MKYLVTAITLVIASVAGYQLWRTLAAPSAEVVGPVGSASDVLLEPVPISEGIAARTAPIDRAGEPAIGRTALSADDARTLVLPVDLGTRLDPEELLDRGDVEPVDIGERLSVEDLRYRDSAEPVDVGAAMAVSDPPAWREASTIDIGERLSVDGASVITERVATDLGPPLWLDPDDGGP